MCRSLPLTVAVLLAACGPAARAGLLQTPAPDGLAPGPGAAVVTAYTPDPAVNEAVKHRLLEGIAKTDPAAARKLQTALAAQDLRDVWAKAVAADGLRPNDVADALASYWVLNWLIVHRQTDNTAAQVQGTRRQIVGALAKLPALRAATDATRQDLAEVAIYNFVLQFAAYQDATGRHDAGQIGTLAIAAELRFKSEYRIDLNRMALTDEGLRPLGSSALPSAAASPAAPPAPAAPVTGTPGTGLKADDIQRVGVAHWFGITPTGLANDYDVYVLLRDASVYHDPAVALADLDVAASKTREPKKWGRWSESGGSVTFTWAQGKPETRPAGDLSTCRPAETGLRLDKRFSRTGGSGPTIPGGIVTLTESELNLHRDGTFDRASATAVGGGTGTGGTVGGGVRGPAAAGRYALDGYAIELDPASGPSTRSFFCRYADDDAMVFVGTAPWLVR